MRTPPKTLPELREGEHFEYKYEYEDSEVVGVWLHLTGYGLEVWNVLSMSEIEAARFDILRSRILELLTELRKAAGEE